MMADVLRHIYILYIYIRADIVRLIYYVRYVMADVLRQVRMADTLRPTKTAISQQIYSARTS